MKIGFVLDDQIDSPNGVQQSVLILGKWLRARGHEVVAFCAAGSAGEREHSIDGFGSIFALATTHKVRFNGNRISTPTRLIPMSETTRRAIESCEILHIQAPYGPLVGHRVIRASSPEAQVVASFHMAAAHRHVAFGGLVASILMATSLRRIDRVVCDSPASQELMSSVWRKRSSSLISHPLDSSQYSPTLRSPSSSSEFFDVTFVGRLVERKGCKYLLQAIADLSPSVLQRTRLGVVGDGPLSARLKQEALSLGISSRVRFYGQLSDSDKALVLRNSDLAVFPATGGESFGMVLLEAMGCGTPVLAFDNEGYKYVLRQAPASLVRCRDVGALAARMDELIQDPDKLQLLKSEQQSLLTQYDVDRIGLQYLDLYRGDSSLSGRVTG